MRTAALHVVAGSLCNTARVCVSQVSLLIALLGWRQLAAHAVLHPTMPACPGDRGSAALHRFMEGVLAVERVLQDYLVSVGKASLVEETPEIYSWITVHDSSTSFHGRHYHRNHAMTAVMYLDVSNTTVCIRT